MSLQIHNDLLKIITDTLDARGLSECTVGTVVTDSPVTVEISVTEEVFSERFLIIPESLRDHEVDISSSGSRQRATIHSGLKKGDSVIIMKCFQGQKLLILDRL